MQDLGKQFGIFSWKNLHGAFAAVTRGEHAHQIELMTEHSLCIRTQFLATGQCLFQPISDFRRIEDQRQKLLKFTGIHPISKQTFHKRPERSGRIVDDVPKLFVFTVNVADDVNCSLWQGHHG